MISSTRKRQFLFRRIIAFDHVGIFELARAHSTNTRTGVADFDLVVCKKRENRKFPHQNPPNLAGGLLWSSLFFGGVNNRPQQRRFFAARFPGSSKTSPSPSAAAVTSLFDDEETTSNNYYSSPDDDMDKKIIKLLSLHADKLPKPCDPLTYCFSGHGMRRRFEPIAASSSSKKRDHDDRFLTFTICSYNVLCQRTLNYYLEKLYTHCPLEYLTWERRWPLLAVELQMLDADVFCLQEVQHDHFENNYYPLLSSLGYDGVFKKKLKKKSDGCATFWRRDKFKPVLIQPIEYALPAPHDHSDSVAVIAVLEAIDIGDQQKKSDNDKRRRMMIVANTHLIYQPAFGATKLCQAALLLAHLQKITNQYKSPSPPISTSATTTADHTDQRDIDNIDDIPLILCGDFNSTPFSPLYSLFVDGQLRYEGLKSWTISGQQQQQQQSVSINNQNQSQNRRLLYSIGDAVLGSVLLPPHDDNEDKAECSELCHVITDGGCQNNIDQNEGSGGGGRLFHRLNLRSVYDHVTKDTGECEVTTFLRDQPACSVDYIFYRSSSSSINKDDDHDHDRYDRSASGGGGDRRGSPPSSLLRCLERYRLPGASRLNRTIGFLPNQYCASDHLPLMAKFALLDGWNE